MWVKRGLAMKKQVIEQIKEFYEASPYPHQRLETKDDLLRWEHGKVMKRILATVALTPENLKGMNVLDAGCGTGEKAAYCALHGAKVDAFDISGKSIEIAKRNARKIGVEVNYQVDAFETVKLTKKYDLILCIGTLHHTSDAGGNFIRMAKHVKKNGAIALGLYNVYGRLACRVQRKLLRLGEGNAQKILEKAGVHKEKNTTWAASLADRFGSPYETYHSVEEVLQWFEKTGMKETGAWPEVKLHSKIDMKVQQMKWLLKNRGFFFVGGKKV